MSRWVDMDACPCKDCADIKSCTEASTVCQRYTAWYIGSDVALVRHGHFIENDDGFGETVWECSYCGEWWTLEAGTPYENQYNYCPNCGTKMDEQVAVSEMEITKS